MSSSVSARSSLKDIAAQLSFIVIRFAVIILSFIVFNNQ